MTLLRLVSIALVLLGGIDGWRRVLRHPRTRLIWLAADAGLLILGVILALFARFEALFWLVVLILTLPVFAYIWSPTATTREEAKTQPPMRQSDQANATKLLAWASLAAVATFLLAGVAGVVWNSLPTVAKVGALVCLGGGFLASVALTWKARRSSKTET